ncbi:MAG: hypothetical protein GAK31_00628 [Stenotrophomonas maltophilia]|uniref:Uncharacterized protein n=1 Tax=Stenotrophomonas maltophilia TaxID=40324 RepID=A0A7V8FJV8_STEMA|nr:MAG: hypothetical protein GAK31_00628 [Stenotrophomonas maltophilia]
MRPSPLLSQPLSEACTAFGISTPKRAAAFLAQVGHDSGSLTGAVENLNYVAQGMADTWPSRYAVDPKAKPRRPNDLACAGAEACRDLQQCACEPAW